MAFSFLYLALHALLGALLHGRRGLRVKDIELLVVRHELEILRRQVARPKLRTGDRAVGGRSLPSPRSSRGARLVSPRTPCAGIKPSFAESGVAGRPARTAEAPG
jgi:hypothetical protein